MNSHDRRARPRGSANSSGSTQQHVERMSRARHQRALRDELEEQRAMISDPESWQRRTATRMLKDLTKSGVDVDLEELRAGWATNTSAAAQRQKRSAFFFDDDFGDECLPALAAQSDLNRKGDIATRRLQMLNGLRQVAQSPSGTKSAGMCLALTNGISDLGIGGRSQLRGQGTSGSTDWDRLLRCDSSAHSLAPPHGHRWKGPLDEDSDEDIHCDSVSPSSSGSRSRWAQGAKGTGNGVLARRIEDADRKMGRVSTSNVDADDPWSAWESRWAKAFRDMDNMARAKRQAEFYHEEQERRRLWEEADRLREGDVKRQHERKAEQGRFWEEAYKKASAGAPSSSSSSSARRPPNSSSHRASGANASGPKPAQPAPSPPPVPKALEVPRFASFAAYQEAWSAFETKVSGDNLLSYKDIPWPLSLSSVSGAAGTDAPADRKKKLRGALLRWHPDKWAPLFARVKDEDKQKVTEQIKEVTRRILEEKQRFEAG